MILTTKEYAIRSGLSVNVLRRLFHEGLLPGIRFGSGKGKTRLLFNAEDCDAALRALATAEQQRQRALANADQ